MSSVVKRYLVFSLCLLLYVVSAHPAPNHVITTVNHSFDQKELMEPFYYSNWLKVEKEVWGRER